MFIVVNAERHLHNREWDAVAFQTSIQCLHFIWISVVIVVVVVVATTAALRTQTQQKTETGKCMMHGE